MLLPAFFFSSEFFPVYIVKFKKTTKIDALFPFTITMWRCSTRPPWPGRS